MIPLYEMSGIGKSIETVRLVVARGWERRGWGVTANRYRVSFWGDENVLKLDSGAGLHNLVNILKTTELYALK